MSSLGQLSQLQHLEVRVRSWENEPPQPGWFTALTASTQLTALELRWSSRHFGAHLFDLFKPGIVYSHLRSISLDGNWLNHTPATHFMPRSIQQIQLLPEAAPHLEGLKYVLDNDAPPTACFPCSNCQH
jgi:hypothetical protein